MDLDLNSSLCKEKYALLKFLPYYKHTHTAQDSTTAMDLDLNFINTHVIAGLVGGNPEKSEATVRRYFTKDAVFKHPFFLLEGHDDIASLYAWWANFNTEMIPYPGATRMWVQTPKHTTSDSASISVVLDMTYQTVPFLNFFIFKMRHSARIVVVLDLQRRRDGRYLITRQEDLIQVDSFLSALFPHLLAQPVVIFTRLCLRAWGQFIVLFLGPLMAMVRTIF
jgi:hypothetical protein